MAVASNADDYAVSRQNIFFPANNETPVDGNLTGQCVTLVKWFMAEMANVPSPFAARGDARYVGKNLVAQGHAVEVPYDQRKRGDIVCLEYGTYGHIYVQLSGGRVFEENVNLSGVASKIVDGERVYASRIGSDAEAWRHDKHVYRLKSYKEEGEDVVNPSREQVIQVFNDYLHKAPSNEDEIKFYTSQDIRVLYENVLGATKPGAAEVKEAFAKYLPATNDPNAVPYYTGQGKDLLYKNIAGVLLDQVKNGTGSTDAAKKLQAIKDALGVK